MSIFFCCIKYAVSLCQFQVEQPCVAQDNPRGAYIRKFKYHKEEKPPTHFLTLRVWIPALMYGKRKICGVRCYGTLFRLQTEWCRFQLLRPGTA